MTEDNTGERRKSALVSMGSLVQAQFGVTISPPVVLNTNAAADSGHDSFPQATTDGQGHWVAVWGSTGLGLPSGHEELATGFLDTVYRANMTLGQATLAGKINLVGSFDLVDTFTLLGDPATQLNTTARPWPVNMYLPAIRR